MTFETEDQKLLTPEQLQKQQEILAKIEEMYGVVDGFGKHLDGGVIETVAILNLMNFNTRASCEGHLETGLQGPWVQLEAIGRPAGADDRSEEQEKRTWELVRQVCDQYGLTIEQLKQKENGVILQELRDLFEAEPVSKELEQWREKNKLLLEQMNKLIAEFEAQSPSSEPNLNIAIEKMGLHSYFRIYCGGEDYINRKDTTNLSDQEKDNINQKLFKYQARFKEFSDFLKNKYIQV
ncbi:MAG: hypothetical protein QG603_474 [Patescibacteria group bacterium]|nr:hypothetical protein [Patescibacteria group bacterium]MDQ5970697.1 hypothetical protein [Patescibacteria group bacterium]